MDIYASAYTLVDCHVSPQATNALAGGAHARGIARDGAGAHILTRAHHSTHASYVLIVYTGDVRRG